MLTPTEPPRLFASHVRLGRFVREVAARFEQEALTGDSASALGIVLPEEVRRAVSKRQAEFLAGRACARDAIRLLEPTFDAVIPIEDRAPRWPRGIVGSITHTAGFAWAAVAWASDVRGVGIDAESIPTPSRRAAIERFVAAPGDGAPPPSSSEDAIATHFGLLFSAKESVFKCLHPIVRKMFWYQDAAVAFDPAGETFRATLLLDLDAELRAGTVLEGRYGVANGRVHTALVLL